MEATDLETERNTASERAKALFPRKLSLGLTVVSAFWRNLGLGENDNWVNPAWGWR